MSALFRAALLSAALVLGACDTEIVLTESQRPGFAEISVVDAAGVCIPGAGLTMIPPNAGFDRVTVASTCPFTTGGQAGDWTLEVTPPRGYALAPGQANLVPYRIARDRKTSVTVRVVKTGP